MGMIASLQKKEWPAWTPDAVALLGLLVYSIQSIVYASTTISNLDEGAYLLKGVLFASGEHHPFEPGIWTNKAPLAFLIPGYVQLLFGAGLRTGRYLAVLFGIMAVLGTWVVSRRLAGRWLGAAAVWVLALSPMVIKIYSGGATQSTIACMLAWTLVFCLGERRPAWQLAMAGVLAGTMMMVRQNMVPVLPLLIIYAFWQHGYRAWWLLAAGVSSTAIIFAIYWPEVLQLWTWLPLIEIPSELTYNGVGNRTWNPDIGFGNRLLSTLQAFRFHFVVLFGGLLSLFLWPRSSQWKSPVEFRVVVTLAVLFWGLVFMHATAAVGGEYCVFCFTPYMAFFNVAGIVLLVVLIRSWNWQQPPVLVQTSLVILAVVLFMGIGFSAFEDIGSTLLNLPAPRVRDAKILPGFVTWWDILSNGLHLNSNAARRYASSAFGLLIGCLFTLLVWLFWRRTRHNSGSVSYGAWYVSSILIFGMFLTPLLSGNDAGFDCETNVITAHEQIGAHLKGIIPDGELVYWDGGLSVAPLLYLPGVEIIPSQINNGYSFISGGDTEELRRFGLWNEEMDAEWLKTADFFIIEGKRYAGWKEFFTPDLFDEYEPTPVGTSCLAQTQLRIFRRK